MPRQDTATRLRRLIERLWNQGDLGAIRELCHPEVLLYCPHGNQLQGLRAYQEYAAMVLGMYPDLHVDVHEIVVAESRATLRYTWSGTFAGGLTPLGHAPAGRRVSVPGMALYHLLEGRIMVGWASEDWLSMYQQLGVLPQHAGTEHEAQPSDARAQSALSRAA
jgi:predicted ester cyclase